MGKKQNKQKPKTGPARPTVKQKETKNLKAYLGGIITVFAFILYVQSVGHNYFMDDHPAIDENKITTQGFAGIPTLLKTDYWYGYQDKLRGPIYRPTSLIIYAIVWQFSPNSPHIYHFINVLLFALTCLILFLLLCELFNKYNLIFPFVCAILYTAHPIHTEVVNTIKSLDEILCFLFGILSLWLILKYYSKSSLPMLVAGGISFYLCLISKETGITFLAIIPLAIYFFTEVPLKKNLAITAMLAGLTVIYMISRMIILKDIHPSSEVTASVLNNTLNAAPDLASKYATIFYILLRYLILLIFPHPLTCDYNYSQIKIHTLADPLAILAIIVYLAAGILSLFYFRRKNIAAFGFLFFVITLSPVSNIFFLGGSTLAERFMYTPSLGFCIALTYFIIKITRTEWVKNKISNFAQLFTKNSALFICLSVIVLLYSVKVFSRNPVWKDTLTTFSHDITTSSNSATANQILGISLYDKVRNSPEGKSKTDTLELAKKYLKKALNIHTYSIPMYFLGDIYYIQRNYDSAYYYQKRILKISPDDITTSYNLGLTLNSLNKFDEAIEVLNRTVTMDSKNENAWSNLGFSYFNKGEYTKAITCYLKVIELNPKRADAYSNMGTCFFQQLDYPKAIDAFEHSIKIDPNSALAYSGLGGAYSNIKDYSKALEYLKKSYELDSTNALCLQNLGITYKKMGDMAAAEKYFEKVKRLTR